MGRVGSGTIYRTLVKARYPAVHCHYLEKSKMRDMNAWWTVKKNNRDVYVISPIRKPVRRNLSAYFLNNHQNSGLSLSDFMKHYNHEVPLTWLDNELGKFWGVDVYAEPFDKARGWQIYKGHILIIRAMNIDAEWDNAFNALTGENAPPLVYDNVTKQPLYKEFLNKKPPKEYYEWMHSSKYYQHFYGKE